MPQKDIPRLPRLATGTPPHLRAIPKSERLRIKPNRGAGYYAARKRAMRKGSIFYILSLLKKLIMCR